MVPSEVLARSIGKFGALRFRALTDSLVDVGKSILLGIGGLKTA